MTTPKTLIAVLDARTINLSEDSWNPLRQLGELRIFPATSPDQLLSHANGAQIIITNKVRIDDSAMRQLPGLRCIVELATGYDNIDIAAARANGITVCNAPNYSSQAVAQHVFALLLHICSATADYVNDTAHGVWAASTQFCCIDHHTTELSGKTFGILGLGNIGRQVANIANAFGMKVIAQTSRPQSTLPPYIHAVDKETLLVESDVLTLHAPLTEQTRNYIDSSAIARLKPDTIIINTARGRLVDEDALAQALREKRLAAYAADVLSTEPPSPDNPLLHSPNTYLTPHIAWATHEARLRLLHITINNVRSFLNNQPTNVVNK